ncbi:MAG: MFS transporter, partial [Kiritimatiellia bacterium]|nr:MFS transporter [Kiritimatiellia bacterium]
LWIPMAWFPVLMGSGNRTALGILGVATLLHLFGNMSSPAWQSWMADLVPANVRGVFFAWRGRLFSLSMLVGSILIAFVLPRNPDVPHMSLLLLSLFTIASLAGLMEIRLYRKIVDPAESQTSRTDWRTFAVPLRNRDFRVFLGFNLLNVSGVALLGPFLWMHFLTALRMGGLRTTLMLQSAPLLATILISPLLGRALDEFGAKPLMRIGIWGGVGLSLGWFFIGPSDWMLGMLLAGVIQIFWSFMEQANFLLLMRYSSRRDGAQPVVYSTVFNLSVALAGALAGYLGGDLAQRLNESVWVKALAERLQPLPFSPYLILLLIGCGLRFLAGSLFARRLGEIDAADTGTAFWHVSRRMAASLQTTLWLPFRGILSFIPRPQRDVVLPLPADKPSEPEDATRG